MAAAAVTAAAAASATAAAAGAAAGTGTVDFGLMGKVGVRTPQGIAGVDAAQKLARGRLSAGGE